MSNATNAINDSYAQDARDFAAAANAYEAASDNYIQKLGDPKATQKDIGEAEAARRKAELRYTSVIELQKSKHDIMKRLIQLINS